METIYLVLAAAACIAIGIELANYVGSPVLKRVKWLRQNVTPVSGYMTLIMKDLTDPSAYLEFNFAESPEEKLQANILLSSGLHMGDLQKGCEVKLFVDPENEKQVLATFHNGEGFVLAAKRNIA